MLYKNKNLNLIHTLSLAAILGSATVSVSLANDAGTEQAPSKEQKELIQPVEKNTEEASENTIDHAEVDEKLELDAKQEDTEHAEGKCGG